MSLIFVGHDKEQYRIITLFYFHTYVDDVTMLQAILQQLKALKSESNDRHWKINGMVDDVKCMKDDFFGLKERVELLKAYGKYFKDKDWKKDTCPTLPPHIDDALEDIEGCLEDLKDCLEVVEGIHHPCGGTGWRLVALINTYDPQSVCPSNWVKSPQVPGSPQACITGTFTPQTCTRAMISVSEPYTEVCGRAEGLSTRDIGGFSHIIDNPDPTITVDDFFGSGLILSHGGTEHIWSFFAGTAPGDSSDATPGNTESNKCPCLANSGDEPPDFVGSDYFCESGPPTLLVGGIPVPPNVFDMPLWDGLNCESGSMCCSNGAPPYFTKVLDSSTTDPINADLCIEAPSQGVLSISYLELYVR